MRCWLGQVTRSVSKQRWRGCRRGEERGNTEAPRAQSFTEFCATNVEKICALHANSNCAVRVVGSWLCITTSKKFVFSTSFLSSSHSCNRRQLRAESIAVAVLSMPYRQIMADGGRDPGCAARAWAKLNMPFRQQLDVMISVH